MDFRLLGPLEVRGGNQPVELGGPRPRALLAMLVLNAPSVVPAERLVEDLWGEAPPRSAAHLLHVYVSTLRKAFRSAEGRERLVTRAPGYVLEVEPEEIDARRFERLVGDGRRCLVAGDALEASEALRMALALWRGPVLADFRYEPFAQAEIARLDELRIVAREERIEADLALDRAPEVIGELEALIAENPLRERPRAQLMLALYRSGRQAEALESYRETRRTLLDELGIEPWPSLKRLEQAILRQDAELEPVTARRQGRPPLVARKLVSVLVADLARDGGLEGLDAEARLSRVASTFESVHAVLMQHGGTVERLPDERVLGIFGVPTAHEDDALRGARAAAEMRELVDVGIGLETGEAIVDGSSVSGEVVARASRLSQAARPGEVLVGRTGHRLIRHATLTEEDATREGVRLVAVLPQSSPLRHRLDVPFVGREHELGQLRSEFDAVVAERRLRLVTIVGEAGVGKSRLAQELVTLLGDRATVLVGRCVSYGEGITYWPLKEVVRQTAGEATHEALLAVLASDEDRELVARAVAAAIGAAEPAVAREESFWAFRRLFEELAREQPLLLVFEDVHWGESAFFDLVEYLAEGTRGAALALCLARPELLEKRPSWPGVVVLPPLPPPEASRLLEQFPGAPELPEEARRRILEACAGNPLFLEQMLAMLGEEGHSADELSLPLSVRAVLAARLDRLGPAERVVLERASLTGRDVRPAALAALLPEDAHPSLDRHLQSLARRHFLREERGGFRFGHALVQEAAYRSIPKQLRASLHERLGDWLEHEDEGDELVGHHLERAFRLREELEEVDWHARRLALRAAERLAAAGQRALGRDDPSAAANLLGRTASLVPDEESLRLDFLPDLVAALRELPDLARAEAAADDAIAAAAAVGDRRARALLEIERAHVRLMRAEEGSAKEAIDEAERAIGVFEELGDELGLARAWRLIALADRLLGRQSARRSALERALVHVRRTADRRTEAWIFDGLGGVHNYGPSPVRDLLRFAEESLAWARTTGQRFHEAHALAQGFGRACAMLGDFESARRAIEEARTIVEDLGFVWHRAAHASAAGFVETLAGEPQAAERELRAGYELVERSEMTGSYFGMALRDELAEALYVQGRYAEAKELSEASERDAGEDDLQAQVLWRAVRAKVLAREGRLEQAEALARAAVALAEQTEFLLVHANACRDLGEVLRLAGLAADARPVLHDALRLYRQKGDRVSAKRMRAALAELDEQPSTPAPTGR